MKIRTIIAVAIFLYTPISQAAEGRHLLQGVFCNSQGQLEQTLTNPRWESNPKLAVELANIDGVVCTFIDRLHYVVLYPSIIGRPQGGDGPIMYSGILVAVLASGQMRPVDPPARVFFAPGSQLHDLAAEGRI
jgi:hypothetical protein